VVAVLLTLAVPAVPGVAYVTAGSTAAAPPGCVLTRSGTVPARGYLRDPAGLQAGAFWWQASGDPGRRCAGMVQMWLRYPRRENARWLAGIYRGPVLVGVIADQASVMDAGWHVQQFAFRAAGGTAGTICLAARFGHGQTVRTCADPTAAGGSS
jgi:hypothetical protein